MSSLETRVRPLAWRRRQRRLLCFRLTVLAGIVAAILLPTLNRVIAHSLLTAKATIIGSKKLKPARLTRPAFAPVARRC